MACQKYTFADSSTALLNVGGPTRIIHAGGKDYLFEFHEYLGPMMIGKRGNALQTMPPPRSPFYEALYWWLKQGRRLDGNRCIFEWEMELVHIMKQIGPRSWIILNGKPKPFKQASQ